MNKFSSLRRKVFCILALAGIVLYISSCQKATPQPYGIPGSQLPNTITPPTFSANLDFSMSATSFTPIKSFEGSYVVLKGVAPYYTITISFPVSDGPGNYNFGFSPNIRATITSGNGTYVDDSNVFPNGGFIINSITNGKYNLTFNFTPSDSTNAAQSISITQGLITNL